MRAFTLPHAAPATTESPTRSVPLWTMTVATGPRPDSRLASRTTPRARPSGLACSSSSFGHHGQLLEQVVDPRALQGRHLDHDGVAAPRLGHEALLGQLLEDPVDIGVGAVDLVDGHDDGDVGGPGVVDGFDGLGHDPVVGRHHQHHDVGDLGTPGPHGGEGLVARGVDERDAVAARPRPGTRRCAG